MVDFLVLRLISRPAIFLKCQPCQSSDFIAFFSLRSRWMTSPSSGILPVQRMLKCPMAPGMIADSDWKWPENRKTVMGNIAMFFFLMYFKLLDEFNSIFIGEMLVFSLYIYIYVYVWVVFWGALFLLCSLAGFHLECTSNSLGATSLWPAGLPNAIKYFGVRYLLYVHCWQLVLCQSWCTNFRGLPIPMSVKRDNWKLKEI